MSISNNPTKTVEIENSTSKMTSSTYFRLYNARILSAEDYIGIETVCSRIALSS